MRKVFIIGTLHLGFTPKDELREVLEELRLTQLFVELPPEDSEKREVAEKHSDEMAFAYRWAKENNVLVVSYDIGGGNLEKEGAEEDKEYIQLSKEELEEAKKISWRERNKKNAYKGSAWEKIKEKFIDQKKWDAREKQMLENIRQNLADEGTVVILTGAGHLDFFEENLSEAEFLFRS